MIEYLLYSAVTHIFCMLIGVYIGAGMGMAYQRKSYKKILENTKINVKITKKPQKIEINPPKSSKKEFHIPVIKL